MVFFTPIAFTACSPHSIWCHVAYGFTNSGGKYGFLFLLMITGVFYASSADGIKNKTLVFIKSIVALILIFGALAFVNERITKPILKLQRPSHVYMLHQTGLSSAIDSLYHLDKDTRRDFFKSLLKTQPLKFEDIDAGIQEHWIDESGFSFPSGHTFNAFLFAMILSYAILHNRSYPGLRNLFILPFIWAFLVAVSRVAVGAHSALDVSFGAGLGILLGWLFLYVDKTRHWLTRKK